VLHSGTWSGFSSPYNIGASMPQGTKLYIAADPGDANDSDQICTHSSCAASPSGIPGGDVWFDGF
jgi:hypothetical protein